MLSQCCAYDRVMFRHKKHLAVLRKRSRFGRYKHVLRYTKILGKTVLLPQTGLEMPQLPIKTFRFFSLQPLLEIVLTSP